MNQNEIRHELEPLSDTTRVPLKAKENKIRFKEEIDSMSVAESLPSLCFSSPRENHLNDLQKVDLTLNSDEFNHFDIKSCLIDLITECKFLFNLIKIHLI